MPRAYLSVTEKQLPIPPPIQPPHQFLPPPLQHHIIIRLKRDTSLILISLEGDAGRPPNLKQHPTPVSIDGEGQIPRKGHLEQMDLVAAAGNLVVD